MPIRIRKSIKIAPGTRINVSKRGVSASVGAKGVSYSTGKSGCASILALPFVLIAGIFKGAKKKK